MKIIKNHFRTVRKLEQTNKENYSLKSKLDKSDNDNQNLKSKFKEEERKLKNNQEVLEERNQELNKLKSVEYKFELVQKTLSAETKQSPELETILTLTKEFREFMNSEKSVENEAEQVEKLRTIEEELKQNDAFKEIQTKNIIAVGGGFSSGKSTFINRWIENQEIRLPVGINPVTAIPTYILSGKQGSIQGLDHKGGKFEIAAKLYGKLDHEFIKSLGFNLKSILPCFSINTPLQDYKNLAFIDTPGYNPSKTQGWTAEDKKTAKIFLEQASSLLWLVGLDANGTLPQTDLNFLKQLGLEEKSLYILLNKASQKPISDLEKILDEVQEKLEDEDIKFEGISAYDSLKKKEYCFRKKNLGGFLQEKEEKRDLSGLKLIKKQLKGIFETYEKAIQQEKKERDSIQNKLSKLKIATIKMKDDSLSAQFESELQSISNQLRKQKFEIQLETLQDLEKKIEKALHHFFALNKSDMEQFKEEKKQELENKLENLKEEKKQELENKLENLKEEKNFFEMVQVCNELINLNPHNHGYYNYRGLAYYNLENYQQAITDYTEAIRINPTNDKYYNYRGDAYFGLEKYEKAITDYTEAIKINPTNDIYYNYRGLAYFGLEKYEKVITDLTEAIKINPTNDIYYRNRGLAYFGLEKYEKVITDLTEAIKINPTNDIYYSNRGLAYFGLEKYQQAITDLTEAIKINPTNDIYYRNRGLAYFGLEKYQQAITDLTEAIKINPTNDIYYRNRGLAYFGLEKYEKVITDLTEAIKINPTNDKYYNHRGLVYDALKKKYEGFFFNDPEYEEYEAKAQSDFKKAEELGYKE